MMPTSFDVKRSFSCLLLFALSVNESWSKHSALCGNSHLMGPSGNITSPHYPVLPLHLFVSCTWHILSPPNSTLKIHIGDFDIPEDDDCVHPPCCNNNWLSLPVNERLCGNVSLPVVTVSQLRSIITFRYASTDSHVRRGFHLSYSIEKKHHCGDYQFLCKDSRCLQMSKKCDGIPQCSDGDDEYQCIGGTDMQCPEGGISCGPLSKQCFTPSQLCDGITQCIYGEDEYGCDPVCRHGIACSQGGGCYLPAERCDGHTDCGDGSDEAMCPDDLCPLLPNKRQCRNGRCIQARLWCDGTDDCGDFSDEESCLKNSVITIAMMGALLGGLLLVLAVGCSLRLYSRRYSNSHIYQMRLSPPGIASRLRLTCSSGSYYPVPSSQFLLPTPHSSSSSPIEPVTIVSSPAPDFNGFMMPHSLSLPALIDNEFFHREPPPVYSVAVSGGSSGVVAAAGGGVPRRSRSNRSRSSSRRSHHSHRHGRLIPKPPSQEILNDSWSSPSSEDSLAPVTAPDTDDNEQLLTA